MSNKKALTILFIMIGAILFLFSVVTLVTKKESPKKENPPKEEVESPEKKDATLKLIKEINEEENYLVSPYSIKIALGMLKEGAKENTFTEIDDFIGKINYKDLSSKGKISVSNGLFIKNKYKELVETSFTDTLKDKYKSEIIYDEFSSPKVINDWANEKTNGMIKNLLDEMDPNFVTGVINAVAIDLKWESPFECENTKQVKFTKNDGTELDVEMMNKSYTDPSKKYFETENAKGVIIPYEKIDNTSLEFVGILPNKTTKEYVSSLSQTEIDNIDKNAKTATDNYIIRLGLPRFEYEYEVKNFIGNLTNLGIKDVFDGGRANLYNIISKEKLDSNNINNLYVSTAIHKTYIELTEEGTKAAAVTYFGVDENSAIEEEPPTNVDITFDKPFVYMIRDKDTKEILFFGAVYSPNEWNGTTCDK